MLFSNLRTQSANSGTTKGTKDTKFAAGIVCAKRSYWTVFAVDSGEIDPRSISVPIFRVLRGWLHFYFG